jgi:hypothetical protein
MTKTILEKMLELLTPAGSWTQGVSARDKEGREIFHLRSSRATCWCLSGAHAYVSPHDYDSTPPWRTLTETCGIDPVTFNDDPNTTHADILKVLQKAIEKENTQC